MSNIGVNRSKVVFINLTEMDEYSGLEKNLKGGGKFIEKHGYGYEILNFKPDEGKCFGYTPPYGNINLSRISKEICRDGHGMYIDDVSVVFTCSRKSEGRLVCGFYQHARVYSKLVKDNRRMRLIETNGKREFFEYNIVCEMKNAFLINRNDRVKQLPSSKSNDNVGYGQSSIWYVDEPERQGLKNELLDYIDKLINRLNHSDEYKHHLYKEGNAHITSTNRINRSQRAKNECIRLKGCYCNICGFDFEKVYGQLGKDYIEVHHLIPLGELSIAEDYSGTDPIRDLIPLCSNCHSMIHRRKEPYQPSEIKALLGIN